MLERSKMILGCSRRVLMYNDIKPERPWAKGCEREPLGKHMVDQPTTDEQWQARTIEEPFCAQRHAGKARMRRDYG